MATNEETRELGPDTIQPEDRMITTGWKNPPKLADLKADLEGASSHHSAHVSEVNVWLDNLNVTGGAKPTYRRGRSGVQPKLIRKQAEWRYASLSESFLSHENLFTTEPVTYEDGNAAKQNGLILNNQWNTQLDKVAFIDEYVRAAVDEGSIIVRVGWDYEEKKIKVPNMVPRKVNDSFKKRLIEDGARMLMQNPQGAQQLPPKLMESIQLSLELGEMSELVQDGLRDDIEVVRNQPTAEVCDYAAVTIDPTCKGIIKNAQFVIYEWDTSRGDLEKDGRYQNLGAIDWTSEGSNKVASESRHDEMESFEFKDEPRKKVKAHEYWGFWDINNDGIPVSFIATWIGVTMIRLELSPFPNNELPFILVPYLPKRKSVYGEPDGALLEDNQKIMGAITRGMIDTMGRSAAGQVGYRKDALDVTNQRKFDAGLDFAFNPTVDPRSAFHSYIYPEIPQSAQFMIQLQNNEAEAMTGVKAFHQGISGEGLGRSATAARSALDAAGKREIGILRRLAGGIIEIGRKIIAMNAVFLSEEESVRITNEDFVQIKRDDLAGKIDVKLKISTAEADDNKAQELSFMLQTIGNTLPPEFALLIMKEIAELRKMPALAKRIEEFEPTPDPVQQEIQQLELQKLKKEIMKLDSEAAENYAEAELDRAKAGEAGSEQNLKDLEFVEKESGVTQARDLERQGAQAEAQEGLEVTKSILNNQADKGGNNTNS